MPDADFDYGSLLGIVDVLLGGVPTEAHLRSAANRAYYGAYGALRKSLFISLNADCFNGRGRHVDLLRACKDRRASSAVQVVGKLLEKLCLLRERADYEWGTEVNKGEILSSRRESYTAIAKIKHLNQADLNFIYSELVRTM